MTVSELADLVLLKMHEYAETHGHGKIMYIEKLASQLGETDLKKVRNVAIALKKRGLIDAYIRYNQSLGFISGEGSMLVERGGDTGVIAKYQQNPSSVVLNINNSTNIQGNVSHSNVAAHSSNVTQSVEISPTVEEVLQAIVHQLEQDSSISQDRLADALQDIETIRLQLSKTRKNESLIHSVLGNLADISSIGSLVTQLAQLILS